MNRWIDASLPIADDSLVWPGDPPVRVRPTCRIGKGDICNESRIDIGSHCTTHVDAPYHFDESGQRIDEVDPHVFIGPAWLLHVEGPGPIKSRHLRDIPRGEFDRVLFKTANTDILGRPPFREDYVGVDPDAAELLVANRCRLVGIDYYSICPFTDLVTTHRILLGHGVAIIEGLVLSEVEAGPVEVVALPLKITGGDASPVRVLIRPR